MADTLDFRGGFTDHSQFDPLDKVTTVALMDYINLLPDIRYYQILLAGRILTGLQE